METIETSLSRRTFLSAAAASGVGAFAAPSVATATERRSSPPSPLKAGSAQRELGVTSVETGLPVYARAVVVTDGETTVGLLSADLILMKRATSQQIRASISAAGVAMDEVVVAATHTHFVAGSADPTPAMIDAMSQSLIDAHNALAPATVRSGSASKYHLSTNRASTGGVFGHNDTAGRDVDPDRDVDPQLSLLLIEPDDGPPTILYNYAIHVIADFVPFAAERVRAQIPDAIVSFQQGAAGDINPWLAIDWQDHYNVRDHKKIEYDKWIGAQVGDLVLAAAADARSKLIPEQSMTARSQEVQLELKSVDVPALQAEIETLTKEIDCAGIPPTPATHHPLTRERHYDATDIALADMGTSLPATIQYIRLADLGIVTVPGEAFVQHGLDFKAAMPTETTMVAGYANEYFHYIPTVDQLKYGGYGTRNRWLSPHGITTMRSTALSLMAD